MVAPQIQPRFSSTAVVVTPDGVEVVEEEAGDAHDEVEVTLYLIRHGEAEHNILEKRAQEAAAEAAVQRGLQRNSSEVKLEMEEARKAVLLDESLRDPPLSAAGIAIAETTKACLSELTRERGCPPPGVVLVSPLQRTLQTAAYVFPDHPNICACEEIQERQTGLACDTRSSTELLSCRKTFEKICLETIVREEAARAEVEDKAMLRARTLELLSLLERSEHRSVALVTHKGYLRELERGPFCRPDATECGNGEMRVYRLFLSHDPQSGERRVVADRVVPPPRDKL